MTFLLELVFLKLFHISHLTLTGERSQKDEHDGATDESSPPTTYPPLILHNVFPHRSPLRLYLKERRGQTREREEKAPVRVDDIDNSLWYELREEELFFPVERFSIMSLSGRETIGNDSGKER